MLPSIHDDPYADDAAARTMIVRFDDAPTAIVPLVRPAARRGPLRSLLPWVGFGLVAVVIVAGAVSWASALRGTQTPAAAVLGESAVASAPPTVNGPGTPPPAALAPPAPTAKRTVPQARRTKAQATPPAAPPVVVAPVTPAPTTVAPTTKPGLTWPTFPLGPGYTAGCTDPASATDPACKDEDAAVPAAPPAP